jgi:hypothetical protein
MYATNNKMLEIGVASMGLNNLQHEPLRLLSEAERLNAELESLVMDNYRIFVENLTCSVHLQTEVIVLVMIPDLNKLTDKLIDNDE